MPRGERGGGVVKGKSEATLDNGWGQSPLLADAKMGGAAADLITSAQVTPLAAAASLSRAASFGKRRSHRLYPIDQVIDVVRRGYGAGFRQTGHTRGEWDIAADCQSPVPVQMDGAPCSLQGKRLPGRSFGLTLFTRCRKCARCLKRRSILWARRATDEITFSPRTWFATFTARPAEQSLLRMRASHRLRQGGTDLRALSPAQQFEELCKEFGSELTLYLKRLRKNTGAKFRYLLVAERHKSGLPHFHALIHEYESGALKHAQLTSAWKLGFTKFKVVNAVQTAWYVAKYLAKSSEARVRASRDYGNASGKVETRSTARVVLWPPVTDNPATPKKSLVAHEIEEFKDAERIQTPPHPGNTSRRLQTVATYRWAQSVWETFGFRPQDNPWATNWRR